MKTTTILLLFLFLSCKQKENKVTIIPDTSFANEWVNKTEYRETQDYVKNLDYDLLKNPEAHPIFKEMLSILIKVIDGESLAVIPAIQTALDSAEHETVRSVYLDLVYELLIDAGKYKAAVDNFPNAKRTDVIANSKFPEEGYEKAADPIKQPILEKIEIGYFTLDIKANNIPLKAYFDTGSEVTHLSKSYAEKIGLTYNTDDKISVYTSNSKDVYAYPAYIDELIVGGVKIINHPVMVFEDETITINDKGNIIKLNFTLGWSLMRNVKFKLDFIQNQYEATLSNKTYNGFKNLFWMGYPGVKVNTTNGQSLIFGLDSGARNTELRNNCLAKMDLQNVKDKFKLFSEDFYSSRFIICYLQYHIFF